VSPARTSSFAGFYAVRAEDCVETKSTGATIYSNSRMALHPNGDRLYSIERSSYSRITRIDISVDPPTRAYDSPYFGSEYTVCPDPFISEDGLRIFSGCGTTFRAGDAKAEDMTYAGKLEGSKRLQHLAHSRAGKVVVSIPAVESTAYPKAPNEDARIVLHSDDFLALKRTLGLAAFTLGGKTAVSHGRFVFARTDGSEYYVVVQADPSAGFLADYGLVTIER
jgi:hypothetical protein